VVLASENFNPDGSLARTQEVVFEISEDFLGCASREGVFTVLNPSWLRTFGYTEEELMAGPIVDFLHPADREGTTGELDKLVEGGGSVSFINRFDVKDDGWRWLSWQAALRDGSIYVIAHNVTERIANEQSHLLLTHMVAGVDDAIFTHTTDGVITSWNSVCEEIFGYTAEEAIGRPMTKLIVPEDRERERAQIVEHLLGGGGVRQYTTERRRKDGSAITVSQTASLMRDDKHEVLGVVVVSRDTSEENLKEDGFSNEIDTLVWVGRVRDAIDDNRIIFYAQPILSLRGAPKSYELLCRMKGRDGEIIQPGQFLPAAENYGLIEELDRLAILEAASLIARGNQISINLSTSTIGRTHIVDVIADELHRAGAEPSNLTVEITETALMKNMFSAQKFSAELAGLGARLALDDFGTGFGGFTYLKKLDISRLKIDVEFVRDLHSSLASQHVVKAVVALAEGLGLETVAEGVEDAQSAKMLDEYGVSFVQGYYYATPGPIVAVIDESDSIGVTGG